MEVRRIGRLVILAGAVGILVGATLAALADDSTRGLLDRSSTGSVVLSLLVLGLAAWHYRAWGLGKLVALGLLGAGALQFTLWDFGDGTPLWEKFTGAELVASWMVVVSAAVVLIGVLWSFVELTRAAGERSEDVAASVAWWRRWGMLVAGLAAALWILGQVLAETESPIDTVDGDDERPPQEQPQEEAWSITADGESPGSYIFHMVKTFGPLEEADVEDVGGRFVWPEAEVDLCDIQIQAAGDGFVQIGILSPTTEGCPGMLQAFVDFGVPETACLFVRSDGVDDEHCAPLAVG